MTDRCRSRRLAALALAVVAGLYVSDAAAQWSWKEDNGRVVYSDRPPPPNIKSSQILRQPNIGTPEPATRASTDAGAAADKPAAPASASPAAPKSVAKRDMEFRKCQQERADCERKAQDGGAAEGGAPRGGGGRRREGAPFLLQPLVENAIKHGVLRSRGPATLTVRIGRKGDELEVVIENSYRAGEQGIGNGNGSGESVGLRNVRERLDTLYAARHRFHSGAQGDAWRVEIGLPFEQEA